MSQETGREMRRDKHAREVEASQARLRENIDEARRLVDESDEMLRRHRREREEDEAAEGS